MLTLTAASPPSPVTANLLMRNGPPSISFQPAGACHSGLCGPAVAGPGEPPSPVAARLPIGGCAGGRDDSDEAPCCPGVVRFPMGGCEGGSAGSEDATGSLADCQLKFLR